MDPPPLQSATSAAVQVVPSFHPRDGAYVGVVLVKQRFVASRNGHVTRTDGAEIRIADAWWNEDEPETSSIKYPSDLCLGKPSTDVIVVGSAIAAYRQPSASLDVRIRVGPIQKVLRVFGDRAWYRHSSRRMRLTDPMPFEEMPIVWERAWGGSDYETDPERPLEEPRNPNGIGVVRDPSELEGKPGPNIEDPTALIEDHRTCPPPAGVGAISRSWAPRRDFAGTYDETWMKERMPLLPLDFDERFNQCAAPDQITPQPLRGGELVEVMNMHEEGPFSFRLPRVHWFVGVQTADRLSEHPPQLDTVLLEPNTRTVDLTWRSIVPLPRRASELRHIQVHEKEVI